MHATPVHARKIWIWAAQIGKKNADVAQFRDIVDGFLLQNTSLDSKSAQNQVVSVGKW